MIRLFNTTQPACSVWGSRLTRPWPGLRDYPHQKAQAPK